MFLKLFLIAYIFIFSLGAADATPYLSNTTASNTISTPQAIICLKNYESENSIACAYSNTFEITGQKDDKENYSEGNLFKTSPQYKFLQEIYSKSNNLIYFSKFDKLSLYLKNEICTRAP